MCWLVSLVASVVMVVLQAAAASPSSEVMSPLRSVAHQDHRISLANTSTTQARFRTARVWAAALRIGSSKRSRVLVSNAVETPHTILTVHRVTIVRTVPAMRLCRRCFPRRRKLYNRFFRQVSKRVRRNGIAAAALLRASRPVRMVWIAREQPLL